MIKSLSNVTFVSSSLNESRDLEDAWNERNSLLLIIEPLKTSHIFTHLGYFRYTYVTHKMHIQKVYDIDLQISSSAQFCAIESISHTPVKVDNE